MPFPGIKLLPVWDVYTLKDRVRQLTQFNFTMKPPCVHTKQWYNYDVISTNNRIPYFNRYKWTNRKSVLRLVGSQLSIMLLPHLGWFAPVTNGCQTLSTHSRLHSMHFVVVRLRLQFALTSHVTLLLNLPLTETTGTKTCDWRCCCWSSFCRWFMHLLQPDPKCWKRQPMAIFSRLPWCSSLCACLPCAYLVLTLCGFALRSTRMTRPRVQRTSPWRNPSLWI